MPRSPRVRSLLLHALLGWAALGLGAPAWGQGLPEYRLKAAFLYNFAAFTEWPADTGSRLNLCIYGTDPFGAEIDPLNGKKLGERSLAVYRKSTPESLKSCQLVFIAAANRSQLAGVLEVLRGQPVLTVADAPGTLQQGVMLNMALAQGRITFEANLAAARSARLGLSSKLLRLATEVLQ